MSLKDTIQLHTNEAMKAGENSSLAVLRMLLASITSKEKEKRYKIAKEETQLNDEELAVKSMLADDEILSVVTSEIKKRKDAIALYAQGNRPELAKAEEKEIVGLQKYLPEQLPVEELKKLVKDSIAKTQATSMKDMGKVMAYLNPLIKGKADGGEVSKIVKEILSQ